MSIHSMVKRALVLQTLSLYKCINSSDALVVTCISSPSSPGVRACCLGTCERSSGSPQERDNGARAGPDRSRHQEAGRSWGCVRFSLKARCRGHLVRGGKPTTSHCVTGHGLGWKLSTSCSGLWVSCASGIQGFTVHRTRALFALFAWCIAQRHGNAQIAVCMHR